MDRREILALAAIAVPAAGSIMLPRIADAQTDAAQATTFRILDQIQETNSFVTDQDSYFQTRWGAFIHADLEVTFGSPDGNEANETVYVRLNELMPFEFDNWATSQAPQLSSLVGENRQELAEVLLSLQGENQDTYGNWLANVGVFPQGRLASTILSGQLLATLASVAIQEDRGETFLERISRLEWWFYPLCIS